MRRLLPAIFLGLAIAACGGKLASEENDRTIVFGGPTSDGGASTFPSPPSADIGSLAGLVLWLKASDGVAVTDGHVKNWIDQSPEHNDLALYDGEGATLQPGIAGMQTVSFDGTSSYSLPFDTALDEWSGDFLVEIVLRANYTQSTLQAFFSCAGTPPNVPGFTRAVFYLDDDQTSECSVDSDGYENESKTSSLGSSPTLVGFWRHGTTLESHRNALVDRKVALPQTATPSCGTTIFGAELTEDLEQRENYFASQIAEVAVVHGTLTSQQVSAAEQGLITKYVIR